MTYGIVILEPPVFNFRVRIKAGGYFGHHRSELWRDIAITGGHTMEDLALYILEAFDFDNDHLSSFYMSGKRWDRSTEIRVVGEVEDPTGDFLFSPLRATKNWPTESPPFARDVLLNAAPLPGKVGKKEFLYIFDFGDNWEFGVRLMERRDDIDPYAIYPRVIASMGEAPDQYPDPDRFWGAGDDDEQDSGAENATLLTFPTRDTRQ